MRFINYSLSKKSFNGLVILNVSILTIICATTMFNIFTSLAFQNDCFIMSTRDKNNVYNSHTQKANCIQNQTTLIKSIVYKSQPNQNQSLTIRGKGFGTRKPYDGTSNYIRISKKSGDIRLWNAGSTQELPIPCLVTLKITLWSDTEIIVDSFTGWYGSWGWIIKEGDTIEVQVWNAQNLHTGYSIVSLKAKNAVTEY